MIFGCEKTTNDQTTPCFDAAAKGDCNAMLSCINKNIDLNSQNSDGLSLIAVAAASGNQDIVELLIKHGASISTKVTGFHPFMLPLLIIIWIQ